MLKFLILNLGDFKLFSFVNVDLIIYIVYLKNNNKKNFIYWDC